MLLGLGEAIYAYVGGNPSNLIDEDGRLGHAPGRGPYSKGEGPGQSIGDFLATFYEEVIDPLLYQLQAVGPEVGVLGIIGNEAKEACGIYEFSATSGKTYVGQSGNIAKRLEQHIASGKIQPGAVVNTTEVIDSKTTREIAEQTRINELGGVNNLENVRNPIGPARQDLMIPPP